MIPSEDDLKNTFINCLMHLKRLAEASGTIEAAIAVHSNNNIRGSAIEDVLGIKNTGRLLKGSVEFGGIRLHIITEKTRGSLLRGPVVAAYVSPRLLPKLMLDERVTDFIFLPWTRQDEASFYHGQAPEILSPPRGWVPPTAPFESIDSDLDSEVTLGFRDSSTPEQRVLPLEHTIDPGFVNHRRIETILGPEGQEAINRKMAALPPMPEGLRAVRVARIYSDLMLSYCRATQAPPLGMLLKQGKGKIFCSTEKVGPCRSIYNDVRAVNKWKPPSRYPAPVEFAYSTAHITADTTRSELYMGGLLSIIGELHSLGPTKIVLHPLVIGGPWLTSPDPRWADEVVWWAREFYENAVEDIAEFSEVLKFPKPLSCEPMNDVSELAFKHCLAEILGGDVPKDWGGENSDFYTAHLRLGGQRMSGAFLLKGPTRFAPMKLNMLGKNNDQIVRLSSEPADILVVQHCHEITSPVRATLRAFAVQPSRPRRFCLIDGRDSLWLLQAYGLYEKALKLSGGKTPSQRRGRRPA
jgi:hypothetical protein